MEKFMKNKLLNFYFDYNPNFDEKVLKNNGIMMFSKNIADDACNFAYIADFDGLDKFDTEFKIRNRKPAFYLQTKPTGGFKIIYEDNFLYFEDISKLYKKFKLFKSADVEIEQVLQSQEKRFIDIFDKCYGEPSPDNPYSSIDCNAYSTTILKNTKLRSDCKNLLYLIKYKEKDVGCIVLTIKGDLCYISGLAILKDYRRTKVFTSMVDILKILIDKKVKDVFCVTEVGGYPEGLYKKLGFKSAVVMHLCVRK